ncbi:MAG: regulatory protein RecX [Bacteroidales bacterium]
MDYKEGVNRAAAFCASSEHCRSEVVDKLEKWGVSPEDTDSIIEYLQKEGYLNEERYAEFYVRDKYRINKWGRVKIEYSLRQKRVERSAISSALDTIDQDLYMDNLCDLLKAKSRTVSSKDSYDRRAKLYRFAASRGFDSEEISRALSRLDIPQE